MDSGDDRVLVPMPLNSADSMMGEMQQQNFLTNYEDPAAALLTYFINENDGGAAIVPVPPSTTSTGYQAPYSGDHHQYTGRISDQVLTGVHVARQDIHQRNALPHMNKSQADHRPHIPLAPMNHTYDLHAQPTPVTSSSFSSILNNVSSSESLKASLDTGLTNIPTSRHQQIDKNDASLPTYTSSLPVPSSPQSNHKVNQDNNVPSASVSTKPVQTTNIIAAKIVPAETQKPKIPEIVKSETVVAETGVLSEQIGRARTIVRLTIIDQVLVDGKVVSESTKEDEHIREGGSVTWPKTTQATASSITTPKMASRGRPPLHSPKTVEREAKRSASPAAVSNEKQNGHKFSPATKAGRQAKRQKLKEGFDSMPEKPKGKLEEVASEKERIETASALLALQLNTVPVQACDSSPTAIQEHEKGDLKTLKFVPVTLGRQVLAKWVDRNFYPGRVSQNQGDQRWQVLFDDGGKRIVHETEIISVPHLCSNQFVMLTFSEGFCLKGMIKRPFYEKANLFYDVEYTDTRNKKTVTEKFSKRDIFLSPEMGLALLNKQTKETPENATKFADVDLNNIIPKRSRQTNQAKVLDKSDDTSADETESTPVKVKKSKSQHRS
ncbi:hypothetical protein HDE_02949 [Halotydeus destructor]|nr:hypothetical protein HDE_02949 [Halotydeus destructor]